MKKLYGFGFNPLESEHHFFIDIPKSYREKIIVYESFNFNNEKHTFTDAIAKAAISKHKWDLVKDALQREFNKRLKELKKNICKWKTGIVYIEKLFGKELITLLWAIEYCDPSLIENAIRNWNGLRPEERWWLYTLTNASTGKLNDNIGWRKALRYALSENPILAKAIESKLIGKTIRVKKNRSI